MKQSGPIWGILTQFLWKCSKSPINVPPCPTREGAQAEQNDGPVFT